MRGVPRARKRSQATEGWQPPLVRTHAPARSAIRLVLPQMRVLVAPPPGAPRGAPVAVRAEDVSDDAEQRHLLAHGYRRDADSSDVWWKPADAADTLALLEVRASDRGAR